MIEILGIEKFKKLRCLEQVKRTISDYKGDIVLGAFSAPLIGIELKGRVVYNLEYLHDCCPPFEYGYKEILKNNHVIDFSRSNINYLNEIGINAHYMPYGYHECQKAHYAIKEDPEFDVMFIGSMHFERRNKIIDHLSKYLKVKTITDCYGDELNNQLGNAKVHLNMHHADGQPLETVRLNYLLSSRCNVVSELGSDDELNSLYGNGLTFAFKKEDILDACMFAIEHPKCGEEFMKTIKHNSDDAYQWFLGGKLCQQ